MSQDFLYDRGVELKGTSLLGKSIDFVVTGGIAAIEAPRQIRELRRFGAKVRVWMTPSAKRFVSPLVFKWASENPVIHDLSGSAEHIASSEALLISPCTLNYLAKLYLGIADSAATTLGQSALGRLPVFILPTMHLSLSTDTAYARNRAALKKIPHVYFLDGEQSESKRKTLNPEELTAQVSHLIQRKKMSPVLVTLGRTKSYLDRVRYLSNYSTGATGLSIAEELYRQGAPVVILAGETSFPLPSYFSVILAETNRDLQQAFELALEEIKPSAIVHAAALLDFEFETKQETKLSSEEDLEFFLSPAPKIIDLWEGSLAYKIAFKLESSLKREDFEKRLRFWNRSKKADLVVGNLLEDVGDDFHRTLILDQSTDVFLETKTNQELAILITQKILKSKRGIEAIAIRRPTIESP